MIFLTLGTQLPFDRLVKAVDQLSENYPSIEFFGQVGRTKYKPKNFKFVEMLDAHEFQQKFHAANIIIGHAGIGTILNARKHKKPLIVMARRSSLSEHRNDHQLATAEQLSSLKGLYVVNGCDDMGHLLSLKNLEAMEDSDLEPKKQLINKISELIRGN